MIVVCGEALIDVVRQAGGSEQAAPGGGPFNTARALARLGVATTFLGHLSNDEHGRELAAALRHDGVGLDLATFGPEPSTMAIAEVGAGGQARFRFEVAGSSAPNLTRDAIPEDFDSDVTALCVGSLGLALEPMASTLAALAARERGKRVAFVDPNVRPNLGPSKAYRERLRKVIAGASIVKASQADIAWIYPGVDAAVAARKISDQGADLVVVTDGADGAFGVHRDLDVRVAAPRVRVVDTIGAGDVFGAALLAWLHDRDRLQPHFQLEREELRAALEFACLAAAMTCTRAGADPPNRVELHRWARVRAGR